MLGSETPLPGTSMRWPCLIPLYFALLAPALAQTTQTLVVGNREYTLPSDTPVLVDDEPGVLGDLLGRPAGMRLTWLPSPDGMRGPPTMVFSYALIGTVTGVAPLRVLGQEVTTTGETVLEGFTDPDELPIGTPLVVAGLVDVNGSLLASLVERRGAQGNKYLLSGHVQELQVTPARLRLGQQWLAIDGVVFEACAGGVPAVGDYVELRADSNPDYAPGDLIDSITSARCANPVPYGTPGAQGSLESLVGTVGPGDTFTFGELVVAWNKATVFEFGGPDDLEPGADVGVEGTFIDADHFTADSVEFVRPVVRFEAPMLPEDVTAGESIRPFGVAVLYSAQVRDEDGILADGLAQPAQVEVRGWIDRLGINYAYRVRERGQPDAADVSLRAPVAAISAPTLDMLGLAIDTTGATFFDADDLPISEQAFFEQVRLNHVVDISAASWSAPDRTLTGGSIVLLGYEHTQPLPGKAGSIVAGTVRSYGVGDPVFADGFDGAR
jgi:hypothetical protein